MTPNTKQWPQWSLLRNPQRTYHNAASHSNVAEFRERQQRRREDAQKRDKQ